MILRKAMSCMALGHGEIIFSRKVFRLLKSDGSFLPTSIRNTGCMPEKLERRTTRALLLANRPFSTAINLV